MRNACALYRGVTYSDMQRRHALSHRRRPVLDEMQLPASVKSIDAYEFAGIPRILPGPSAIIRSCTRTRWKSRGRGFRSLRNPSNHLNLTRDVPLRSQQRNPKPAHPPGADYGAEVPI